MDEIWRPVVGWEGQYEISSCGRARSLDRRFFRNGSRRADGCWVSRKGQLLDPTPDKDGYLQVSLGRTKKAKVHVLILEAFVGPRPEGMTSRHINGKNADNVIENLAWGTYMEQEADKFLHGTRLPKNSITHCLRGHEYTEENTYAPPSGSYRQCRACQRERQTV